MIIGILVFLIGEVANSVFDRYRDDTYRKASYKPYIIAAMILLGKRKDPNATLKTLLGSYCIRADTLTMALVAC